MIGFALRCGAALIASVLVTTPSPVNAQIVSVTAFQGEFATVNSFVFSNGIALAVLDAQRKPADAARLVELIRGLHLPLAYVLISHGHTDHFTGMAALHHAFPDAEIVVANADIKHDIEDYADYMDRGGQIGGASLLDPSIRRQSASNPEGFDYDGTIRVLGSSRLSLPGGGELVLSTDYLPAEAPHMTTVYSPDLNALFLADFGYNKVHLWLGDDVSLERIANWRAEMDHIEQEYVARSPKVYPGHGEPTDLSLCTITKAYLDDFVSVVTIVGSRTEAQNAMKQLYPGYQQADFFLKYSVENHVR